LVRDAYYGPVFFTFPHFEAPGGNVCACLPIVRVLLFGLVENSNYGSESSMALASGTTELFNAAAHGTHRSPTIERNAIEGNALTGAAGCAAH
jgi:hypothetical protein